MMASAGGHHKGAKSLQSAIGVWGLNEGHQKATAASVKSKVIDSSKMSLT
jgi:hypothetical protein